MKANELLIWLSARREGSWRQFRQAVQELHSSSGETDFENDDEFPLHQQLRLNLQRLAHVEFFALGCDDGWRVAPPTLAVHSASDGVRGILCGARSPELWNRVIQSAELLTSQILDLPGSPQIIRIDAPEASALSELADRTGLLVQKDAPLAMLLQLPPCSPPKQGYRASEFPQGADWIIHYFDSRSLVWREGNRCKADTVSIGVFRFRIYFQKPRYFLRWKGITFEMSRAVALYVLLHRHRHKVLRYNPQAASLSVPAICRPPLLLERALVLCSGLPPSYEGGRLTYSDVPHSIAKVASELLRQPLI
jgi:hypothetical protein